MAIGDINMDDLRKGNVGPDNAKGSEQLSPTLQQIKNLPSHSRSGADLQHQGGINQPTDPRVAEERGRLILLQMINGSLDILQGAESMATIVRYTSMAQSPRTDIYKKATKELFNRNKLPIPKYLEEIIS